MTVAEIEDLAVPADSAAGIVPARGEPAGAAAPPTDSQASGGKVRRTARRSAKPRVVLAEQPTTRRRRGAYGSRPSPGSPAGNLHSGSVRVPTPVVAAQRTGGIGVALPAAESAAVASAPGASVASANAGLKAASGRILFAALIGVAFGLGMLLPSLVSRTLGATRAAPDLVAIAVHTATGHPFADLQKPTDPTAIAAGVPNAVPDPASSPASSTSRSEDAAAARAADAVATRAAQIEAPLLPVPVPAAITATADGASRAALPRARPSIAISPRQVPAAHEANVVLALGDRAIKDPYAYTEQLADDGCGMHTRDSELRKHLLACLRAGLDGSVDSDPSVDERVRHQRRVGALIHAH